MSSIWCRISVALAEWNGGAVYERCFDWSELGCR